MYKLNKLYFVECIDSTESPHTNALALYNDTATKLKITDDSVETKYFEFKTKEDFFLILDSIYKDEITNSNILIHIYTHGSSKLDGIIGNDKKLITWEEIQNLTRKINIKSKNGLYLILALCHGIYIGEKISIKKKAPFNSLIASKYEEYVTDIYKLFHTFYSNLVFDNNIVRAFKEAQVAEDTFFYKNTNICVQDAFKSLLEKREKHLPILYKEYLKNVLGEKISFEEFDKINRQTFPEIIKNMEEEFFIK